MPELKEIQDKFSDLEGEIDKNQDKSLDDRDIIKLSEQHKKEKGEIIHMMKNNLLPILQRYQEELNTITDPQAKLLQKEISEYITEIHMLSSGNTGSGNTGPGNTGPGNDMNGNGNKNMPRDNGSGGRENNNIQSGLLFTSNIQNMGNKKILGGSVSYGNQTKSGNQFSSSIGASQGLDGSLDNVNIQIGLDTKNNINSISSNQFRQEITQATVQGKVAETIGETSDQILDKKGQIKKELLKIGIKNDLIDSKQFNSDVYWEDIQGKTNDAQRKKIKKDIFPLKNELIGLLAKNESLKK